MTVTTLTSEVKTYLASLAATNPICSVLGTRLVFGSNLFINRETNTSPSVVIISYPGRSPRPDGYKFEARFQILVKHSSNQTGEELSQALINDMAYNMKVVTKGLVQSLDSVPMRFAVRDGGEDTVFVSNFTVKYINPNS
jgi:hypothetical protein